MEKIEEVFNKTFVNWDIRLPQDAVESRQAGKIVQAGWIIEWLFGFDGSGEYLDYYATHRMTSDSHVRIHADGSEESLEAPSEFYVTPGGASEEEAEQAKAEFHARNRRVYNMLREKGFLRRE